MAHFHRAGRYGIGRLQAGHDFTGGKGLDSEIAVGCGGDMLGNIFRAAIDRVERLRKRRRQAPVDLGILLCNGGRGQRCRSSSRKRTFFHKGTAIHLYPPRYERCPQL